uniref:TSA: Wollemia nobilis Ref_Wollemi_Transcript_10482_1587 transcribed RNA sequence n=1 Tax=Wollemia nobilis TaxID=56998 RepID=A0A0C9QTJ1_9CONI
MDNNSCGFHISSREMDIEDDFSSRNSITSLLNSAAASAPSNDGGGGGGGGGRAEPSGASGAMHHSFYESIATYLDNMNPNSNPNPNPNPRAPLGEAQQLLIRKGTAGPGGVDPQEVQTENNIETSTAASTTTSALHAETVSAATYSGMAASRGGCGAANGSGSGRLSLDPAAASKVGKKRSRASRRAPTTVLTTDTSNFRAMVQEFTGIPPAPFASTSPFQRNRLDFLASGARSLQGTTNPFLLRPFPQRMAAGARGFAAAAPNFAVPQQSPPNLLFQSLLQPGGPSLLNKTTSSAAAALCNSNNNSNMILEELGLNPPPNAHVLPDLVPSDRRPSQWGDGGGACKMSYSKAAGDLGRPRTLNLDDTIANTVDPGGHRPHHHHDNNNNNNIHARGADRMVDSWISSSDQTLDKLVQ